MQSAFMMMDLPAGAPSLQIRTFQPGDEVAFRALNESWIRQHFVIEEHDREMLGDPESHILEPGGQILVAVEAGMTAGFVALVPMRPGVYELAKMVVAETHRGRGLGRKLLQAAVDYGREKLRARELYLESSNKLEDAVHLYEAIGFRHLPPERVQASPYARANIFMEMVF